MSQRHTFQDPEQLSQVTIAEDLTRNIHGESLDDARAEFRAKWQAKIDRKRQEAGEARRRAEWLARTKDVVSYHVPLIGAVLGLIVGLVITLDNAAAGPVLLGVLFGFYAGKAIVLPLPTVARSWGKRVERLERELRELELS